MTEIEKLEDESSPDELVEVDPLPPRLNAQVLEKINQRERFKFLAQSLEGRVGDYTEEKITDLLRSRATWPGQHEKALVMLALKGTPKAGEILESFTPHDNRTRAFYSVVVGEYLKRTMRRFNDYVRTLPERPE